MTEIDRIMITSELESSKLADSSIKIYCRWIGEMIDFSRKRALEITKNDVDEWVKWKRRQEKGFKTIQNMRAAGNWWIKVLGHRE